MHMHPVYCSLWRLYLQWQRSLTDRTYQLYGYWCFLTAVRELARLRGLDADRAVPPALGRSGSSLRPMLRRGGEEFELSVDGVKVWFQRTFAYGGRGGPLVFA